MSEADVDWSSESSNVPGLQRDEDDGRVGCKGGLGGREIEVGAGGSSRGAEHAVFNA